jgi:isochorismate synthase
MISTKEKENTKHEKRILQESIYNALQEGKSISLWKTPGVDQKNLIISHAIKEVDEYVLEEGESGFAFASFLPDAKKYFFPADIYYQFENDIQVIGPPLESSPDELPLEFVERTITFHHRPSPNQAAASAPDFIKLVKLGLQQISEGAFEKVVPSRAIDMALNSRTFDLLRAFDALCEKHPQALVSLVSSPETGTWLGATPELLVSVDANHLFKTIALAGTQPYHHEVDLKSVAWTQKEIEEQALVCRYIINCFKKIRLREYEEHGPRTMVAGNVMHLKTIYEVDMAATNFPQLGSVMLKLLHPTSAVCGMPFDRALEFLKKHEGYNREFYSGYLGPVRINNTSLIFVNLRCMQLFDKSVRLFAGAGTTIDSSPEKEFEETEIKMQNLRSLFSTQD